MTWREDTTTGRARVELDETDVAIDIGERLAIVRRSKIVLELPIGLKRLRGRIFLFGLLKEPFIGCRQ